MVARQKLRSSAALSGRHLKVTDGLVLPIGYSDTRANERHEILMPGASITKIVLIDNHNDDSAARQKFNKPHCVDELI
jgi:hypothetical protein